MPTLLGAHAEVCARLGVLPKGQPLGPSLGLEKCTGQKDPRLAATSQNPFRHPPGCSLGRGLTDRVGLGFLTSVLPESFPNSLSLKPQDREGRSYLWTAGW